MKSILSGISMSPSFNRLGRLRLFKMRAPQAALKRGLVFLPGVLLVLVGAAVVFAPRLVLFLLAGMLVLLGVGLCYLGLYLMRVKRRFSEISRQLQGRIVIQGIAVKDAPLQTPEEGGKIIFH